MQLENNIFFIDRWGINRYNNNICKIQFREPQRAPTPGQSGVLYRDEEIVGGGEILK